MQKLVYFPARAQIASTAYPVACLPTVILTEPDAAWKAPTKEIAVARIKAVKGFSKIAENLPLSGIWAKYEVHPDRARPLTPHESLMYRSSLQEFIDYAEGRSGNEKGQRRALSVISDITPEVVSKLEDTCGAGGLKSLLDEVGREFENFSARRTAAATAVPANDWRREDDSVPASEAALKALRAAAMNDGRNVESVCRGYGVDPDRISKHDCWRMTRDLNKRSGCGNA
ncbi:MAG: hypothetical protein IJS01_10465 [Lentisphaeria bacterium]|nr:hypothetical protein [Lentisphaeria bacterium]